MGYEFLNAGASAELFLYSNIGWFGTSADQFRAELETTKGKPLLVHINSQGGDPVDAMAIYNLLATRPNTTTRVDAMAASAASIIAQAGNPRQISNNGWLMIHEPIVASASGNESAMRAAAAGLSAIKMGMALTYAERSKKPLDEVQALMAAETWYTGQQAIEAGFADELIDSIAMQASTRFDPTAFRLFKNTPAQVITTFGVLPPVCGSSPQLLNKEKKSMSLITQCLQRLAGPSEREQRLATILTQAEFPPEELLAHKTDDGLKLLIEAAITNATAQERIQREIVQASLDALIAAMGSAGVKVDLTKPTEVAAAIQAHMDSIASRKMVTLAGSRGITAQVTAPGAVNGATAGAPKTYTQQCVEAKLQAA